eukprot:2686659-Prymnesium_polylepis.1
MTAASGAQPHRARADNGCGYSEERGRESPRALAPSVISEIFGDNGTNHRNSKIKRGLPPYARGFPP